MATSVTVKSNVKKFLFGPRLSLAIFLMGICEALEWLGYCLAGLVLGGEVVVGEDEE